MLRISKLTDYGTVILATLAAAPERRHTASEVAERTRLGVPTVSKLLKSFHRAGILTSERGTHGGYQLAKPAARITASAIIDAIEGPVAITECSGNHSACDLETTCRTGGAWQRINGAIRRSLDEITLAQLSGQEAVAVWRPDLAATFRHGGAGRA
ncbi:MAG TPA: SUF system Fe-S cluster assembly regulator [Steroidobacteraceae bacterium]